MIDHPVTDLSAEPAAEPATTTRTSPPRRLGRPKDVASAETHERLLGVARRAFAQNGFDATTNKNIADAAGITTGAIYHYYTSKAELYAAVYAQVQDIVYGEFEKSVAEHDTLFTQFGAVLDAAVELNRHDPTIAGFVVGVAGEAQRHPELMTLLEPGRDERGRFLSRLVAEANQRGELAAGVSVEALTDLLNAVLSGLARFSNHTGDSHRHEQAIAVLKRFLNGTLTR